MVNRIFFTFFAIFLLGYNEYDLLQTQYIEAILENNKKKEIKVLKKLIPIAKKLGKNYKFYQNELNKLVKKDKKALSYSFKKLIIIDPGHGGKDPGAIGINGIKEKFLVLHLAKLVKKELNKMGFRVLLTREKDKFVSLKKRTEFANKKKGDIFISIHANSSKNKRLHGVETFFLSPSDSKRDKLVAMKENGVERIDFYSKNAFLSFLDMEKIIISNKLAIDIQKAIKKYLSKFGLKDNGVRKGELWVLVGAQMPAVLIEIGYISNKKDYKILTNKKALKTYAKAIAIGIKSFILKNME